MSEVKVAFGERASMFTGEMPMTQNAAMNMRALKSAIMEVVEAGTVHGIFEVTAPFAEKSFLISGSLLKLSNYLIDAAKTAAATSTPERQAALVTVKLIGFTTDRNEARKKGEEV